MELRLLVGNKWGTVLAPPDKAAYRPRERTSRAAAQPSRISSRLSGLTNRCINKIAKRHRRKMKF